MRGEGLVERLRKIMAIVKAIVGWEWLDGNDRLNGDSRHREKLYRARVMQRGERIQACAKDGFCFRSTLWRVLLEPRHKTIFAYDFWHFAGPIISG